MGLIEIILSFAGDIYEVIFLRHIQRNQSVFTCIIIHQRNKQACCKNGSQQYVCGNNVAFF